MIGLRDKLQENHISWENLWVPVDFPLSQPIEQLFAGLRTGFHERQLATGCPGGFQDPLQDDQRQCPSACHLSCGNRDLGMRRGTVERHGSKMVYTQ